MRIVKMGVKDYMVKPFKGEELKSFQETGGIPVVHTIEDARTALC